MTEIRCRKCNRLFGKVVNVKNDLYFEFEVRCKCKLEKVYKIKIKKSEDLESQE